MNIILSVLLGITLISQAVFILLNHNNYKEQDKKPEGNLEKRYNFNKFDIEDDIYSLSFTVTMVSNEYFDNNIINHFEDRSGHNAMKIPKANEHQDHIDSIAATVLDIISDEHIEYLSKYIRVERLKYIIKIMVKKNYTALLEQAQKIREKSVQQDFDSMKDDNEEKKEHPDEIKQILDEYDYSDIDDAMNEVNRINHEKLLQNKKGSTERRMGEKLSILKNYYNNR